MPVGPRENTFVQGPEYCATPLVVSLQIFPVLTYFLMSEAFPVYSHQNNSWHLSVWYILMVNSRSFILGGFMLFITALAAVSH